MSRRSRKGALLPTEAGEGFVMTKALLDQMMAQGCRNGCHVCHEEFILGEALGFSAVSSVHLSPIVVHARCSGRKPGAYITKVDL